MVLQVEKAFPENKKPARGGRIEARKNERRRCRLVFKLESHACWLGLLRVTITTKTLALLASLKSSDMTQYVHRSLSFDFRLALCVPDVND